MKKTTCLLLSLVMVMTMITGCDSKTPAPTEEPTAEATVAATVEPTAEPSVEPSAEPTVEPTEKPAPQEIVIYETSFEDGESGFIARGEETVQVCADDAGEGSSCLAVTNRTASWNGCKLDVTKLLTYGETYKISAKVKSAKASNISFTTENHGAFDSVTYNGIAAQSVKADEWKEFNITYNFYSEVETIYFYFESDNTADFYVDDVVIKVVSSSDVEDPRIRASLSDTCEDYFLVGAAIGPDDIRSKANSAILTYHFNSITTGNEFKPDYLLDYYASKESGDNEHAAVNLKNIDTFCKWARENNIKVRFHTLVWHSQTPKWFFYENYDTTKKQVSREVMLKRMENYIKDVCTYINENYEDVIYCYDVVNEACEVVGDNGIRNVDNPWYDVIGRDYVVQAFTFARKYASPNHKLYYNDFNCCQTGKRENIVALLTELRELGIVDGMGLQSHLGLTDPSIPIYQAAIKGYAATGCEIQITELDIGNDSDSKAKMTALALRYADFFRMYKELDEADNGVDIVAVTIWGITDDTSWLNGTEKKPMYPLLFNADRSGKLALDRILKVMEEE